MTDYENEISKQLDQLKESGSYRYFLTINKNAEQFPLFEFEDETGEKKKAVNWCTNDYLCMSINQEVMNTLSSVTQDSGTGSGGTRNISGTTAYHRELEKTLASLHQKQAALIFGSAYLANLTTLSTLGKLLKDVVFLSDERNHASLIEGMKSAGTRRIFRHNDVLHLEELLKGMPFDQPKIIVFESVYSINGSIAPFKEFVQLARQYNCLTYVDEVHAVGLYGNKGAGVASQLGIQNEIDIINGTLAKGFGVIGGYIAASKTIVDAIRSFGSGFIFTTSLPPAICAAAIKSIELVREDSKLRETFHGNVAQLRNILNQHGVKYSENSSHITPILLGESTLCKKAADRLLHEYGIYLQPINYPTVKRGEECLRVITTTWHTEKDMIHLAKSLQIVLGDKELNIGSV